MTNDTPKNLLGDEALARSDVVANCRMNRERGLTGPNGYTRDLGVCPLEWLLDQPASQTPRRWLDLCCGTGTALVEACVKLQQRTDANVVEITGVDLVDFFHPQARSHPQLTLTVASITTWEPKEQFDLITCVHGLHYVGDKLKVLANAAQWLTPQGRFVANFDAESLNFQGQPKSARQVATFLRNHGFQYSPRTHRVECLGRKEIAWSINYLGADDSTGPNYTGQPAVTSHYLL